MVREFYIENETGQRFSMMDIEKGCFLSSPTGLGISYDIQYEQIGNNFIPNSKKNTQGQPGGELIFKKYDNYRKFIDFVENAENLKFVYKIPFENGLKEYFRDIDISSIDKTEIGTDAVLRVPAIFNCKTLWYEENTIIYTIEPQTDEIRWDFRWDSKFSDYNNRNLNYINNGHIEAPILIEIDGNVINPKIELYVEGKLYQTVEITAEIKEYEKLIYDTRENQFCIDRQNTDGSRTSLFSLDNIKFENDNVIRLPCGRSCEIRLTADNEVLNARITIFPRYKAV